MSRRLLASFVIVLALAAVWLTAPREHVPRSALNAGADVPTAAVVEPEAALAAANEAGSMSRTSVAIADADQVVPVDALWLAGRVEFPPGTPPDESAHVVARWKKATKRGELRFPVAADGSFRAAFADGTSSGTLDVEGRFVFLPRPARIDLGFAEQKLVLRAELGGLVRLRLEPSALVLARGTDLRRARATAYASWFDSDGVDRSRSAFADETGVVELGGLSPQAPWTIRVVLDCAGAPSVERVTPKSGEAIERKVVLARAPRFAGVVRGPRGEPVARATIRLRSTRGESVVGSADDQGRFDVYADSAGTVTLAAAATGFVGVEVGPFDAVEGFERTQIGLRLDDGFVIEGVVRWPGGDPASGAAVRLYGLGRYSARDASDRVVLSGADGSFRFGGLDGSASTVVARARPGSARASDSADAWWTAVRGTIPPGTRDVVLVLGPGATLRGRVVDDLGRPVAASHVRAEPVGEAAAGRSSVSARDDDSGSFELGGLRDGEWSLVAMDGDSNESKRELVVLPRDAQRVIQLVMPRLASIAGRVLDADGTPASDAIVSAWPTGGRSMALGRSLRTTADGKFRIEKVRVVAVTLEALRDDRVPSVKQELAVIPGHAHEDVELVLRLGGTVEGRVLDAEDRPRAGADVEVSTQDDRFEKRSVQTGPDGTFRMGHVRPGTATISTAPVPPSPNSFPLYVSVDVQDGQVVRVQLGGKPTGQILVHGSVRSDRQLANVEVLFFTLDEALRGADRTRTGKTDADGNYAVRLSAPGRYFVRAQVPDLGLVQRRVDIADVADQAVDLEFGTGSISGRVVGPDGAAVVGVRVDLRYSDPGPWIPPGMTSVTTLADGAFALRGLLGGTYALSASPDQDRSLAAATVDGLELGYGAHLEDVELRLPRGCSVAVRVVGSDGRPAAGATVGWSQAWDRTDMGGYARLDGLPPREVTLTARTASELEHSPVRVLPRSDRAAEIVIDLVPGGAFTVRLERRDGTTILERTPSVSASDAAGDTWYPDWASAKQNGLLKFRPVRPGIYKVTAQFGSKHAETQVQVTAGGNQVVVLREPE